MSDAPSTQGIPGGIAVPGVLFLVSIGVFLYAFAHPGTIDLGPNINPAGIAVIFGSITFFWLLFAIARRPAPPA